MTNYQSYGFTDVLLKPFRVEDLSNSLKQLRAQKTAFQFNAVKKTDVHKSSVSDFIAGGNGKTTPCRWTIIFTRRLETLSLPNFLFGSDRGHKASGIL
jgi:hypothetical protein